MSLLRWQAQDELADKIRRHYGGGEILADFDDRLDKAGVRYAATDSGDISFLELACATRRGACVGVHEGRHMVILVYLDRERACLLDNNHVNEYDWLSREDFIREWKRAGGYAFVPVYSPYPPLPRRPK